MVNSVQDVAHLAATSSVRSYVQHVVLQLPTDGPDGIPGRDSPKRFAKTVSIELGQFVVTLCLWESRVDDLLPQVHPEQLVERLDERRCSRLPVGVEPSGVAINLSHVEVNDQFRLGSGRPLG